MDKIKQLLEQLNASPELAKQIVEALDAYKAKLEESNKASLAKSKSELDAEFNARTKKAKAVYLEELQRFKTDLARKAKVFFESKSSKIEQQLAKQNAIRESNAENKLKQVYALLEGVNLNEKGEADLQALKDKMAKLQSMKQKLLEERDMAVQKANRAHAIATKALKRNKLLEEAKAAKPAAKPTVVVENVEKKGSRPTTTRATAPHQIEKPQVQPTQQRPNTMSYSDPRSIAESIN